MKPRWTSSTGLFAKRGDPWMTEREKSREFPMRRTVIAEEKPDPPVLTELEKSLKKIKDSLHDAIDDVAKDYGKSILVDPDLDRYTKATQAVAKRAFVDQPGTETEADFARKLANHRMKINAARRTGTVDVKPRHGNPHKVKGSFYRFPDVTEKIHDLTDSEAVKRRGGRPFLGKPKT